ncbi:outer membrane beta-barrel protein [Opitutales bacterium]|nr:outer membrane beta-barrel protein [Opitutales bacterium]
MKIQESLLIASILLLSGLPVSVQAGPLVSIGDSVDVFFSGSSSVKWQSNVLYDENDEIEDLLFTLSPGFEVNVGRGVSNLDLNIITSYDILRYDDLTDLDNELFHIKAVSSYKSTRWDVSGSVSYDEKQSSGADGNTNRLGRLTESDELRANLEGEYRLSPKFSIGSGVKYSDVEYQDEPGIADRETTTIPLDIFYELSPKVDLSVGYQYRTSEVGEVSLGDTTFGRFTNSYDKTSHFFNVGARGELLPKLTGFFKVGYRETDSDDSDIRSYDSGNLTSSKSNRKSQSTLGLDADLTYSVTPKVTSRLNLRRDFGVGGEGQSTENTSVDVSATYSINMHYSASAFGGYTLREYTESDNDDNIYRIGARLSYVPNEFWRFSAGYMYVENDSDRALQSYENHILDLSASLRY